MDFAAIAPLRPGASQRHRRRSVAAVGVLAFGPLYGLLLAVAGSVLGLVYRSSRVDVEVMGKVPHEKAAWGGIRNHGERPTFPGVLVLRVDAPIFWVTAAPVHDVVLSKVEAAPDTRALVLDMEATNQMDTTSADMLAELLASYDSAISTSTWSASCGRYAGAAPVRADGRARRGPPVAQHLAGRARGPARARPRPAGAQGAPPPDGTSTDGASTDGTSTDGTSTDGTSTDEPLDADDEEHIVARDPGPDPPDQRRQGSL